ncbi:DUF6053 domain-containing protein [Lysobacter enzymogenes]
MGGPSGPMLLSRIAAQPRKEKQSG